MKTDWECVSLANNPRFRAMIEASRRGLREQGGTSIDEVRQRLGLQSGKPTAKAKRPRKKA